MFGVYRAVATVAYKFMDLHACRLNDYNVTIVHVFKHCSI